MSFTDLLSSLRCQISKVLPSSFSTSWNGYNLLPTNENGFGSIQVKPHFARYFQCQSKYVRWAAIILFIILLLLLTYFFLPLPSLDDLRDKDHMAQSPLQDQIDWSRFAYVQYATDQLYLCNSVMLFEILHRLESKADRLLMYPSTFIVHDGDPAPQSEQSRLLKKARDEYDVKLQPIELQHRQVGDPTWAESYTKLLAFNQTQYDRVLSLDSDSTVLQIMDELFLMPPSPVAMPRAYWLNPDARILSSQLILLQPSEFEYERIVRATREAAQGEYDMEIMNKLYRDSCFILPHRPYNLLTGEFRADSHSPYLGNVEELWDPDATLEEAKFLHFSDWPMPKPWIQASDSQIQDLQPKCTGSPRLNGSVTCRERELWREFYEDFARRRQDICGESKSRRDVGTPGTSSADIYMLESQ